MSNNNLRKVGKVPEVDMRMAVDLVYGGESIRSVAISTGINRSTLARYVQKQKCTTVAIRMEPNYSNRKIFSTEQEDALVEYIINSSKRFYGLPLKACRKLAYEMAIVNNCKVPEIWHTEKMAGEEWLRCFRSRNKRLSLRTPEGCSLSRATSFNRHNVELFYNNLYEAMGRSTNFANGTRIYNLDETATVTVQKPQKVLAEKGIRQVAQMTSAERGALVTTCCIISATGQFLPPAMVFPRVFFKAHMLKGAPPGTIGLATQSGWMNADLFLKVYFKIFITSTI